MIWKILHTLGFHRWVYTGSTRKCKACGLEQYSAQLFNGDDISVWLDSKYLPK